MSKDIFERDEANESLDKAIEVAEDILERARQRFSTIEKQYQAALSQEVIAANQLLDLILKRMNHHYVITDENE